ncbi:hypothetical protein WA158_008139 [Blastocystis sp. Blastoise]
MNQDTTYWNELLEEIDTENDWPSEAQSLSELEKLLRCPICKNIIDGAVVLTTCGHSCCSLCIKRFLSTQSKCPICRVSCNEGNILRNILLEEICHSFKTNRSSMLILANKISKRLHRKRKILESKQSPIDMTSNAESDYLNKRQKKEVNEDISVDSIKSKEDTIIKTNTSENSLDSTAIHIILSQKENQEKTNIQSLSENSHSSKSSHYSRSSKDVSNSDNSDSDFVPLQINISNKNSPQLIHKPKKQSPVVIKQKIKSLKSPIDNSIDNNKDIVIGNNKDIVIGNNKGIVMDNNKGIVMDNNKDIVVDNNTIISSNNVNTTTVTNILQDTTISLINTSSDDNDDNIENESCDSMTESDDEVGCQCPICGKYYPDTKIERHANRCISQKEKNTFKGFSSEDKKYKKLPTLIWSLLSLNDLKKKLNEYNIYEKGLSKTDMIDRLRNFTIYYNSECDKSHPSPKWKLVQTFLNIERRKSKK